VEIETENKTPCVEMGDCILCGVCSEVAPHTFKLTDEGFIEVLSLNDYSDDLTHEAIINCPKDCISWE